jgi:hypothetical protein
MIKETLIKNSYNKVLKNLISKTIISGRDMKIIIEYQNRKVLNELKLELNFEGVIHMEHYLIINN